MDNASFSQLTLEPSATIYTDGSGVCAGSSISAEKHQMIWQEAFAKGFAAGWKSCWNMKLSSGNKEISGSPSHDMGDAANALLAIGAHDESLLPPLNEHDIFAASVDWTDDTPPALICEEVTAAPINHETATASNCSEFWSESSSSLNAEESPGHPIESPPAQVEEGSKDELSTFADREAAQCEKTSEMGLNASEVICTTTNKAEFPEEGLNNVTSSPPEVIDLTQDTELDTLSPSKKFPKRKRGTPITEEGRKIRITTEKVTLLQVVTRQRRDEPVSWNRRRNAWITLRSRDLLGTTVREGDLESVEIKVNLWGNCRLLYKGCCWKGEDVLEQWTVELSSHEIEQLLQRPHEAIDGKLNWHIT